MTSLINTDLPGSYLDFDTSLLNYSSNEFGTTESVCIIGTAFNGPVGVPVQIENPKYCEYVFGGVFDPISKKEASLTASVLDAWDRGCRTIYAVRISGEDVAKSYKLAASKYQLRLSSKFPSNKIKDVSLVVDTTGGDYKFTLYKPASLATIRQKALGVTSDAQILESVIELSTLYNLNAKSSLTEAIDLFNKKTENNVVKLSIVDEKGVDITISGEAKGITLDNILPGLYVIGRDKTNGIATTQIGFENINGIQRMKVELNSDIQAPYPINAISANGISAVEILNAKLPVSTKQAELFDFVKTLGKIDIAFGADDKDYEQVDLTPLDIYSKLGGGFANTMKIVAKDESNISKGYRKIPAPKEDPNAVAAYKTGILPSIENLDCSYRVIAGVYADTKINSKKIKLTDFKTMVKKSQTIGRLSDKLYIESIISPESDKLPLEYQIQVIFGEDYDPQKQFSNFNDKAVELINIYKAADYEAKLDFTSKSLFFLKEELDGTKILMRKSPKGYFEIKDPITYQEYDNKIFLVKVDTSPAQRLDELVLHRITNEGGSYKAIPLLLDVDEVAIPFVSYDAFAAFSSYNQMVNVYKINSTITTSTHRNIDKIELIGLYDDVFNEEEEEDLVVGFEQTIGSASSTLLIRHKGLDYTSFDTFVDELNSHHTLRAYFNFAVTDANVMNQDVAELLVEDDRKYYTENSIDLTTSPIDGTTNPLKFTFTYTRGGSPLVLTDAINLIKNYDGSSITQNTQSLFDDIQSQLADSFSANSLEFDDYIEMSLVLDDLDSENKGTIKIFFKENSSTLAITNNSGTGNHTTGLVLLGFATSELSITSSDYLTFIKEFVDREETFNTNLYIPYKTNDNFLRLLAQHCAYSTLKNNITHGIVGVERLMDTTLDSVANKVQDVINSKFDLYAKTYTGVNILDEDNMPIHIGKYVSCPIFQFAFESGNNYSYISTGAASYAGLISNLDIDVAPTNQIINLPGSPMYTLGSTQIEELTRQGFVTLRKDSNDTYVIVDGVTMDIEGGPFKRFFTTKSMAGVEQVIKNATEPFIGKANNDTVRNSLRTAVTSALKSIKGILINDFEFEIDFESKAVIGEITINYRIVPAFEIKQISNSVKVSASL